jgi:enoyl-CoA hydratase/carnithine racemase
MTPGAPEPAIKVDVDGPVATITLNRPDAMNAMTVDMIQEFVAAVDALDADDDIRCVIVTGAGRAFCAGADLTRRDDAFAWERWDADDGGLREGRNGGGTLTLRIFDSPKPFIGAINGSAVGFGLTMTLPMDIRICADNAKLGFVFARRGMIIDAASGWFLPRVVPMAWAAEWAYSGRLFSAAEAVRSGLVRDALPAADVLDAARTIATGIAEANPVSVSFTKALLWRGSSLAEPRMVHEIDTPALAELAHRPDAAEGVRAFFEKRTPQFESRVSRDMPAGYPWWETPGDS